MAMQAFREALRTQLQTALGVTFVEGMIEGPVEGRDLACIYPVREAEVSGRVVVEQLTVGVRVFKAWASPVSPQVPNHDPDALEALVVLLKDSISAAQKNVGGTWFHRLISVEYDMRRNGFEAVIRAEQQNEAVL